MNETEFREILMDKGYDGPFDFAMEANAADDEHVHDYDVLVMVVEGSLTIEMPSGDETGLVGDTIQYPAGEPHVEKAGPDGVKALVGRRVPA